MAETPLSATGGTTGDFEGAPWGWAVAGLVRACTGCDAAEALCSRLTTPLALSDGLFLRVGEVTARDKVVRHSQSAMMKELGVDMSDFAGASSLGQTSSGGGDDKGGGGGGGSGGGSGGDSGGGSVGEGGGRSSTGPRIEGDDAFAATSGEVDWERFQAPQQLQLPSTFNSWAVKEAGVPGACMFASAKALASFYSALGAGGLLKASTLRRMAQADAATASGTLDGESVHWGLGVQVGTATQGDSGQAVTVIGHRGTGGVVGFTIPAAGLSVAVTLSRLSSERRLTRRLVELVLRECGAWVLQQDGGGLV